MNIMPQDPNDDLSNRIPAYNRVSIRAVLVQSGEDPGPALAAAGIVDPVAIPVLCGDNPTLPGGILGDGITPNLTAVLEHDQPADVPHPAPDRPVPSGSQPAIATRRHGPGAQSKPPLPLRSMDIERVVNGGWRKPPLYVPLKLARSGRAPAMPAAGGRDAAAGQQAGGAVSAPHSTAPTGKPPAGEPPATAGHGNARDQPR